MAVQESTTVIPLWPAGTPGVGDPGQPEQESVIQPNNMKIVRNVAWPTLSVYRPEPTAATGAGVVICPGGAWHFLAIEHEGTAVAQWLVERGIAALVLRYRLIPTAADEAEFWAQYHANMSDDARMRDLTREYRPPAVADGTQALRIARQRAAEWGLLPERLGVIGFSAGASLAVGLGLGYDESTRPAFIAPIYTAPYESLPIPVDAPPLFLALASDDDMAVRASLPLYNAWRDAGCSSELHVFDKGGHGFGMLKQGLPSDGWIDLFGEWIRGLGFLER
jgi:acetyl esterase/lipase